MDGLDSIALDDPSVLDDLAQALPAEIMAAMLAAFADDIRRRRDRLIETLAGGAAEAAGREAHALKGAALNLGFSRLGAAAAALQDMGKTGDLAAMNTALPVFTSICAASLERLELVRNTRDLP